MKPERKAQLYLLGSLAVGVLLGMTGQAALTRNRLRQVDELRRPPGFVAHLREVLGVGPAGAPTIDSILQETAVRNHAIIDSAQRALRQEFAAMRTRLDPLLDDGQRERLDRLRLPNPFAPPPGPGRGPPPRGGEGPPPRPDDGPPKP